METARPSVVFFETVAEEERCGRDRPEEENGGWKILDGYIRIHFIGCGGSLGGLSLYPRRAEISESSRFSWERRSQSVSQSETAT